MALSGPSLLRPFPHPVVFYGTATPACPSRFAFFPPKYLELNNPTSSLRSHAFVEFRSQHDAEDAYYDMCAASALPLSIPLPLHLAVGTAATSKGLA